MQTHPTTNAADAEMQGNSETTRDSKQSAHFSSSNAANFSGSSYQVGSAGGWELSGSSPQGAAQVLLPWGMEGGTAATGMAALPKGDAREGGSL